MSDMADITLISVNIEGDNHFHRLEPFFAKENADVICMQEVFEVDIQRLQAISQTSHFFYRHVMDISAENENNLNPKGSRGTAIFSKIPFQSTQSIEYESEPIDPSFHDGDPRSGHRTLLCVDLNVPIPMKIMTTHFTWSPNGSVTDLQRHDLQNLFKALDAREDFVLCGDFNAPRGKEIFDALATQYKDNIPKDADTSIDGSIHRSGLDLRFMIDGLFTTPAYVAHNVRLVKGVSDHFAICATIQKVR